jgi:hypothetical protein
MDDFALLVVILISLFYQSLSKSADEKEIHQRSLAFFILASLRKQAFDAVSHEKSLSLS